MNTCLIDGSKSRPRERSDVVINTSGVVLGSFRGGAGVDEREVVDFVGSGRKNPSRWWFDPLFLVSLLLVKATFLISRSLRCELNSRTLVLLLQNTSTLDRCPACRWNVDESSAQTLRIRRSMSANLFPPVQETYSGRKVWGRWCSRGEASLMRDGWQFSR